MYYFMSNTIRNSRKSFILQQDGRIKFPKIAHKSAVICQLSWQDEERQLKKDHFRTFIYTSTFPPCKE